MWSHDFLQVVFCIYEHWVKLYSERISKHESWRSKVNISHMGLILSFGMRISSITPRTQPQMS